MVFRSENDGTTGSSGVLASMDRYMEYVVWFDELTQRKRIDRWTAQLGLWELGRRLEKEMKEG